ncbi:hypothetical protein FIBSPDRAFT_851289 [Athelia psychrophila]|uniref:Bromo domain-containing protein n=2 Tax=Athelia psychrophila TaxID=1759441 RepID=A0A166SP83_9AGAM|nr:hypothetical protein FIBSPDRAFT_851289 [Fibularhizoctonia sp. CBS 109695]
MNNLLRTLTAHTGSATEPGLKLLLTTVKDARRGGAGDGKLHDPFYDSLEGLLADLRAVTMDNRDAEAFLKPVARADVPDYYEVIQTPMDLATMGRKVKQKTYKSKREFRDDLDLIWSNCWTYNATDNHPLRQCATRLKAKSERLLASITDRKERTDPSLVLPAPGAGAKTSPKPRLIFDGVHINDTRHGGKDREKQKHHPQDRPRLQASASSSTSARASTSGHAGSSNGQIRGHTQTPSYDPTAPFGETPALVRTQAGMREFAALLEESPADDGGAMEVDDGVRVGEKRKLNGHNHPRKRARSQEGLEEEEWWERVGGAEMLANGMPAYPFASACSPFASTSASAAKPNPNPSAPRKPKRTSKSTKVKSRKGQKPAAGAETSLLALMSANIATLSRVRRTHARFSTLQAEPDVDPDAPPAHNLYLPGSAGPAHPPEPDVDAELGAGDTGEVGEAEAARLREAQRAVWAEAEGELDGEAAGACLQWMGQSVLAHAGFQGAAQSAMDVLAGVASEYLLNVGRTIRLLGDRYGKGGVGGMTAEEIILHTLFESGTTRIQDLERYIKDDVVRYGARLGDLEKKLVGAYREATVAEVALDDDALFGGSDEEEDGAFVMGNFADALGDDFLGLRELGIAAEFGMSNLSVPKKLLRAKKGRVEGNAAAVPKEPPLPYPLPPPFVPLDSANVDHQIGLLKTYYLDRLAHLLPPQPPTLPSSLPGPPSLASLSSLPPPTSEAAPQSAPAGVLILADDPPTPANAKIGPLGQIVRPTLGGTAKKKVKKDPGALGAGEAAPGSVAAVEVLVVKKKKGRPPGPGKKNLKKDAEGEAEMGPPAAVASA